MPGTKEVTQAGLRVAVMWPHPRLERIRPRLSDPSLYEEMDGLSYLADSGIEPVVLESTRGWMNPLAGRGSVWSGIDPARFVRFLLSYGKFDGVIAADSPSALLPVLLRRLLRLRKPIIVYDPALDPSYRNRMRIHALVLPYVDEVIVFGEVQRRFLEKEYGGRARVVFMHHRVDSAFFDPARACGGESNQNQVLSVGNDLGRDFDTLLEAAHGIDAPFLLHTRRKVAEPRPAHVRVQSQWIRMEELRECYASAAVVVVPLKSTLHPSGINALLEAMAMGKAVVVSASPGVTDYVVHGETAWVVPPGDAAAMRDGIAGLLNDSELRLKMGRNARRYCEEVCAMPRYAGTLAARMRRLIAAARA